MWQVGITQLIQSIAKVNPFPIHPYQPMKRYMHSRLRPSPPPSHRFFLVSSLLFISSFLSKNRERQMSLVRCDICNATSQNKKRSLPTLRLHSSTNIMEPINIRLLMKKVLIIIKMHHHHHTPSSRHLMTRESSSGRKKKSFEICLYLLQRAPKPLMTMKITHVHQLIVMTVAGSNPGEV